jgi:signal transduction histidine kinase
MSAENFQPWGPAYQERRKGDRRKILRRAEDKLKEQSLSERNQKLQSLLELGQLIGLDLQIDGMLLQIAQKAAEVMGADRCSLFLYDTITDELWSTVALGMKGQVIRIPSSVGVAGYCFKTGESVNLEDAYADPRFNRDVDAHTGYRTQSLLCMPIFNRNGQTLGVIQLLNKNDGVFTKEDETFLRTFGNHASVFIEMAQLQKARIEALEQSHEELRRLNRAKDKAIHHLSHELNTPLAIIQGTIRLLKRKLQNSASFNEWEKFFDILEKHLSRLFDIQQEADSILRSYPKLDEGLLQEELDRFLGSPKAVSEIPVDLIAQWNDLKTKITQYLPGKSAPLQPIPLSLSVQRILEEIKQKAKHREVLFLVEGRKDLYILTELKVFGEVLEGLLKNAIENTPNEGMIKIISEKAGARVLLKVQDFGIGITGESQKYIFDGLFTTQETELYSSRRPYDFNAGGKGLELLRMKVYGQRFGFDLSAESRRCIHLPTDRDSCPGRISFCHHCRKIEDCLFSGGSTFCVSFPASVETIPERFRTNYGR